MKLKPNPKQSCCGHPHGCKPADPDVDLRNILAGIQCLLDRYKKLKKLRPKTKRS